MEVETIDKGIKRRNRIDRRRTRKDSTSGYKGVSYEEHASEEAKWRAYVLLYNKFTGKQVFFHIGMFPTAEEAYRERALFISKLF
jgi:hypothetical protein